MHEPTLSALANINVHGPHLQGCEAVLQLLRRTTHCSSLSVADRGQQRCCLQAQQAEWNER